MSIHCCIIVALLYVILMAPYASESMPANPLIKIKFISRTQFQK